MGKWDQVKLAHERRMTMTRTGTSYFPSYTAALTYYKDYHYPDTAKAIQRKAREGEIHIGKPAMRPGQRLVLVDNGLRYGIEED
jgi:hypothetical protein